MHKGQGKGGKSEFSPTQKISGKFVPPSQGSVPPSFFLPPFWILGIFSPPVWVLASKSTRKTSKFTKKRGGKIFLPPKNSWKIFPRGKLSPPIRPPTCACMNKRDKNSSFNDFILLRTKPNVKSILSTLVKKDYWKKYFKRDENSIKTEEKKIMAKLS